MSSKAQLAGYSSIAIVDETNQNLDSANTEESWVQANVILPAKLADANQTDQGGEQAQEEVTPIYRDVWFAVLFLIHIAVFSYIGVIYGSVPAMDDGSGNSTSMEEVDTTYSFLKILIPCGVFISFVLTYFITALLLPRYSKLLVEASLYTSLFMWTATALMIFFAFPNIWTILLGVGIVVLNLWYITTVRIFIPFAAANLKLATRAVSSNAGVYFLSFIMGFAGFAWFAFWTYTANGVGLFDEDNSDSTTSASPQTQNQTDDYYYSTDSAVLGLKGFGLLISLYWTLNVFGNITQTTTAGVTGTWCFDKNSASSCCSSAVTQSFMRSCTYSLGSICFGSLLNALVTTLRVMAQFARENARNDRDGGAALIYCIIACILSCIEDIVEYFNQWAYIFVGIYGTSYLESGKRVLELFNARGITAIISNGLASYVLTNVVLSTSLLCGLFGYLLGGFDTVSFW